jgi:hypothetical protein
VARTGTYGGGGDGEVDSPLTSAQAKAYMQQLAVQLKDWKKNLD